MNVALLFWVIKATFIGWLDRKNIFVSLIRARSTPLFSLFEHFPWSSSLMWKKCLKEEPTYLTRFSGDNLFVKRIKKCSRYCYNCYLLSQTSRRVLLAAGFRLNKIVPWFLSSLILYFPRSLKSLPRKLHQQRKTIHHAEIDQRKKPFLLNSSCYRQNHTTSCTSKTRSVSTKLFAYLTDLRGLIYHIKWYEK